MRSAQESVTVCVCVCVCVRERERDRKSGREGASHEGGRECRQISSL